MLWALEWHGGEKLNEHYEVRGLPDVDNSNINSFQFVDKEGGDPFHLVFSQKNGYYIAWGKPDKMIIFNDAKEWFEVKNAAKTDLGRSVLKTPKRSDKRRGRSVLKTPKRSDKRTQRPSLPVTVAHRSRSIVDFHLSTAQECGLNLGYRCLEYEGSDIGTIQVGQVH